MTNQQPNIEHRIDKDRVDQLYKRSKTTSLALFVANTIYILFLSKKIAWPPLLAWYLVLISILAGRMLLNRFYNQTRKKTISLQFWLNMFRLSIFAVGATIGSLNLLFYPHETQSYVLLAIFFPLGITAGAVTILVDFFSFFIYVVTLSSPIVYQTALAGDRLYSVSILTIVLILSFLKFSKEYNDNFILTMRLRYENRTLVDELQQEKTKLNNRLGRILNDSSNEIFVVDADSYKCVQVNKGAIENLGYSESEFADVNLLDIFTDMDRHTFAELLAPLHTGHSETVAHTGNNQRKDGSTYPVEAKIQLSTLDVPPIIVVTVQDITERSKWEKKLIYKANFDQLTGLYNRHYMQSYMHSVFARARRHRMKVALLFMDIDNFKNINDTFGHGIGDKVLQQTASRIRSLLRESDTLARTGGDEFTILLEGLKENVPAEMVARKIVDVFKQPFFLKEREIYATVSIGISIYPEDSEALDQLMQYADVAMYHAKEEGGNSHRFFSREMRRSSEKQMMVSNHLRYALANDEFSLAFQPKIDISSGRIVGAEALLRWNSQELGEISPDIFIPLAENLGLIRDIGSWVLETACQEAMQWQELSSEKLQVSVNVSPQQFRMGNLLEDVDRALELSGLPRDCLEIEITENLLLLDSDRHLTILKNLHDQGVTLALDDFGTGYSSLSYLRRFPLQVLKIDRSFIRDMDENKNSRALVEAIIAMAQSLKLGIVAEGVENKAQLDFLSQRDIKIIQGYHFSLPVPVEKFVTLLQDKSRFVRSADPA